MLYAENGIDHDPGPHRHTPCQHGLCYHHGTGQYVSRIPDCVTKRVEDLLGCQAATGDRRGARRVRARRGGYRHAGAVPELHGRPLHHRHIVRRGAWRHALDRLLCGYRKTGLCIHRGDGRHIHRLHHRPSGRKGSGRDAPALRCCSLHAPLSVSLIPHVHRRAKPAPDHVLVDGRLLERLVG